MPGLLSGRHSAPVRFRRLAFLVIGAAALLSSPAEARCEGQDLYPQVLATAAAQADLARAADRLRFGHGRFWQLSRPGVDPSYVFGTVHLSDPRVTTLSAPVRRKLLGASTLAVETTDLASMGGRGLGARERAELRNVLRAAPDRRARELLDPPTFAILEALAAQRGLPRAAVRSWKASAIAILLDQPPCAKVGPEGAYLDGILVRLARDNDVDVVGLETLAEQFSALDGLAADTERDLLISALKQAARGPDIVETQVRRYAEREAGALLAWLRSEVVPGDPDARTPEPFLDKLIAGRTRRMRDRVLPLLEKGNAFIAVGVAHLPGDDGLIALLEQAGYRVDPAE